MPSPAASVLTEDLPAHLPHARKTLDDICFESGARYAERVKRGLGYHLSKTIPKDGGTTLGKKPDRRQAPS